MVSFAQCDACEETSVSLWVCPLLEPLDEAHDASHPPAAGHDETAHLPTASVVVWPWFVATQRLTDTHAVCIATATLGAAYTCVVQHGVNRHRAVLTLLATLLWGPNALIMNYHPCLIIITVYQCFQRPDKKFIKEKTWNNTDSSLSSGHMSGTSSTCCAAPLNIVLFLIGSFYCM